MACELKPGQSNVTYDMFSADFMSAVMQITEQDSISINGAFAIENEDVVKTINLSIIDNSLSVDESRTVAIPISLCAQFVDLFGKINDKLKKLNVEIPIPPPPEPEEP